MFHKIKSTLDTHSFKQKPSFSNLVTGLAIVSPVAAISTLTIHEIQKNPDGVKHTLSGIGSEIKKDAPVIGNTIGNVLKKGSSIVGGVYDKLIMPFIAIGVVTLFIILKK